MDVDLLNEKLNYFEKELEIFKKDENEKIEKLNSNIKLVEAKIKELRRSDLSPEVINKWKTTETQLSREKAFEKQKARIKNAHKEILSDLRLLKNEKEKRYCMFLNKKFILLRIYEISNDVKQNVTLIKVRGEYFYKSYLDKLLKLKEKCASHFITYENMQKEINLMLELITNNALIDVNVLNANGVFFEKEMAKTFHNFFQHLCTHVGTVIKE